LEKKYAGQVQEKKTNFEACGAKKREPKKTVKNAHMGASTVVGKKEGLEEKQQKKIFRAEKRDTGSQRTGGGESQTERAHRALVKTGLIGKG